MPSGPFSANSSSAALMMACSACSLRGRPGLRPATGAGRVAVEADPWSGPASWSSALRLMTAEDITALSLSARRPGREVLLPDVERFDRIDSPGVGGRVERGLQAGRGCDLEGHRGRFHGGTHGG